jgi:hypothetical protein
MPDKERHRRGILSGKRPEILALRQPEPKLLPEKAQDRHMIRTYVRRSLSMRVPGTRLWADHHSYCTLSQFRDPKLSTARATYPHLRRPVRPVRAIGAWSMFDWTPASRSALVMGWMALRLQAMRYNWVGEYHAQLA